MTTVSIDEATERFKALVELALRGEQVFIETESQVLLLQAIPALPVAPAGFYDDIYDDETIRLDNILAKSSVTTLDPRDDPDNG